MSISEVVPAQPLPANESSPSQQSVVNWTPEERQHWRETGNTPKPKAEPAPAKESSDSGETTTTAAVTEPAKQQERKKQTAAERLNELLADLKQAGLSPSELKTFRKEAQRAERQEEKTAPVAPEKKETKVEAKPRLDDKNADRTAKYKNYQEWEDAKDDWVAAKAVREADASREKQTRELSQKEQAEKASRVWLERVAGARKGIADFDDVVSDHDHPIYKLPTGSVLENFIFQAAEHGPEVLHHLMSKSEEFKRIMEITDWTTLDRELWKLDFSFSKPEKKVKEASAEPTTKAPPPVKEVGGRGTGSDDPERSAALASKGKLTPEFKEAANRGYMARLRPR